MWGSLEKLMALPDETLVYCAHEYTQANAAFAITVEPDNQALQARVEEIAKLRAQGIPTVPTSIGLERQTNPFVRPDSANLRQTIDLVGPIPSLSLPRRVSAKTTFDRSQRWRHCRLSQRVGEGVTGLI